MRTFDLVTLFIICSILVCFVTPEAFISEASAAPPTVSKIKHAPKAKKRSTQAPARKTQLRLDDYRPIAKRLIAAAMKDARAFKRLAFLTDRIGARLSGSVALDRAVRWAQKTFAEDGHENVHAEKVMVPHWVRGKESAEILQPVKRKLVILGIGPSVATPKNGILADVIVVSSFAELEEKKDAVRGKIVLYNVALPKYDPQKGSGYHKVFPYRFEGAVRAARLGARAVLIRSITANSQRTAHTGSMLYQEGVKKIPAAAVTVEDVELMARFAEQGERIRVHVRMHDRTLPDKPSANVIAELKGREKPEEIVVIGAHLDSWDVGNGAHDDGAGCVMVMEALTLLRELGLRPRRTVRVVLFTNEENGVAGRKDYVLKHRSELLHHVAALESDAGGFAPRGFVVHESPGALEKVRRLVKLLEPIRATEVQAGYPGVDIMPIVQSGALGLGLWTDGATYFDVIHSNADTLDKVDPYDLKKAIAAMTVMAYLLAEV